MVAVKVKKQIVKLYCSQPRYHFERAASGFGVSWSIHLTASKPSLSLKLVAKVIKWSIDPSRPAVKLREEIIRLAKQKAGCGN